MSRIRSIKPEFFRHVELYEAEKASGLPLRIAFAGLWTVADREGRFRWRPRVLVLDILPFDEVDFGAVLDALAEHGFIVRYTVGSDTFGYIPTFAQHQYVNQREPASTIPAPDESDARTCKNIPAHGEGEREGNGIGEGRGSGLTRPRAIDPDFKPKDLDANPAEVKRFVAYNLANGATMADWDAAWEVWCSRIADYGEATPPKAQGPPPVATTWLPADDPRWPVASARHEAERGRALVPIRSKHRPDMGATVPTDWLEQPRTH